jgi:Spy/CpxP family protein refolding chaperone
MRKLTLLLLTLTMAVPAAATEFDLPPGKWWENERLAEHIDLSDQQVAEIREVVYAHARQMIDLKAKVELAGLDLAETVNATEFDVAEVRAAYAAFQTSRHTLENERFEMLLAVRQILTDAQWQQLQDIKRRFGEGRGQRRPGAPGQGGDPGQRPPGQRF